MHSSTEETTTVYIPFFISLTLSIKHGLWYKMRTKHYGLGIKHGVADVCFPFPKKHAKGTKLRASAKNNEQRPGGGGGGGGMAKEAK